MEVTELVNKIIKADEVVATFGGTLNCINNGPVINPPPNLFNYSILYPNKPAINPAKKQHEQNNKEFK